MRISYLFPSCAALALCGLFAVSVTPVIASTDSQQANSNAFYRQLRNLQPVGTGISVNNLTLKRDAAVFTFTRGDFAFFGEVNGKVTGAVFRGVGHMNLTPPTPGERRSLTILNKNPEFNMDFAELVLRFTDATAQELAKNAILGSQPQADESMVRASADFRTFQREHLHRNLDLRLLEDVAGSMPVGGYFLATFKASGGSRILYEIDPHGASPVAPEEVLLTVWNDWGFSFPGSFHLGNEYTNGMASSRQENKAFRVDHEDLETSIEKNGFLTGSATVHLIAREDGLAVVPLHLFPTLRVTKVTGEHDETLDYVQEKKEDDPDFGFVLAHPLNKGESTAVHVAYAGKDAVRSEGSDNYDPIAREDWYPSGGFGNYATYKMVFHSPREDQFIATGNKLRDSVDGHIRTTEWDTQMPLPVVGFHLGRFAEKDGKTSDDLAVSAYANTDLPDWASSVRQAAGTSTFGPPRNGIGADVDEPVGTMSTTGTLPVELSQGEAAAQTYEHFFGKLPFDHVALSQQPACNYGQSWPMLVYLPICGFWDGTIQNAFHLRPDDQYWKTVTAHEMAHQWWGHTVGFESYRDQWMSEGFASASAAMFLQATRKTPNDYRDYWKQLKRQLTEKNADGFRPIDVGPVTMGFRLSTQRTGWSVYQNLVYPKGAYILHMVRMMMYSQRTGDADFITMMHDFVNTWRLKVATTEDFKAMLEKHMTSSMNLTHNGKMDWFFDEYVYGTQLPTYRFESQVDGSGDAVTLHFKLTQSGVSDDFRMVVPIYLEQADGRQIELGKAAMVGNNTVEQTVPIAKPPAPLKRALINANHDVLAIEE